MEQCKGFRPGSVRQSMFRATTAASLLLLAACSVVPEHMQVEKGNTPENVNRDVRFRTTYYFRVFDYCEGLKGNEVIKAPFASDTLYRFRLTGKANSLTTSVRFESGTLTAGQIDPLGANVAYDEKNGQHYFKTQSQVQREAEEARQWRELGELTDRYEELRGKLARNIAATQNATKQGAPAQGAPAQGDMTQSAAALDAAMLGKLATLIQGKMDRINQGPQVSGNGDTQAAKAENETNLIQYCAQPKRGFQILGPEGWRTFNQEERLIFAMSASDKPLINTMQELAGRVLESQPRATDLALPLLREDMRANEAGYEIQRMASDAPEALIGHLTKAIKALKGGEGEDK